MVVLYETNWIPMQCNLVVVFSQKLSVIKVKCFNFFNASTFKGRGAIKWPFEHRNLIKNYRNVFAQKDKIVSRQKFQQFNYKHAISMKYIDTYRYVYTGLSIMNPKLHLLLMKEFSFFSASFSGSQFWWHFICGAKWAIKKLLRSTKKGSKSEEANIHTYANTRVHCTRQMNWKKCVHEICRISLSVLNS